MYVWFDALTNYITAVDWYEQGPEFDKFWPADLHLVGKDILRLRCLRQHFWCSRATCLSEFLHMAGGQMRGKISKSLGNVIYPLQLVDEFGCDQTRHLLREAPFDAMETL